MYAIHLSSIPVPEKILVHEEFLKLTSDFSLSNFSPRSDFSLSGLLMVFLLLPEDIFLRLPPGLAAAIESLLVMALDAAMFIDFRRESRELVGTTGEPGDDELKPITDLR